MLADVRESEVETLIPAVGKRLMMLSGKYKGYIGTLIEVDKSR